MVNQYQCPSVKVCTGVAMVTSQFTIVDFKSSVIIVEFGSTRDPEQLRKKVETMYNLAVNHAHGSVDCYVFC